MSLLVKVSRRDFLRIAPAAGAGMIIGIRLARAAGAAGGEGTGAAPATAAAAAPNAAAPPAGAVLSPNAFLQIDAEGAATIWVTRSEMGQGVLTALPMIVAEELGADWGRVKVQQAPFGAQYGEQETGGSSSVRDLFEPLRKAGAAARSMLVAVGARRLGTNPDSCVTEQGQVIHPASGRRVAFSDLVADAAREPMPENPALEDPKRFTIVGRALPRLDTPAKVQGRAVYGIDVTVPGMQYAAVARCPVFGGKARGFKDEKARAVPGVRAVVPIRRGVAVVADSTWAAFKGREALEVSWDEGPGASESTAALRARCEALLKQEGKVLRDDGRTDAALKGAATRVEAVYELPFLAHAPMEPVNATAHVEKDRCTVWAPTQAPGSAHADLMALTGLPADAVRLNVTYLGGGFGRRLMSDFIVDAAEISKAVGAPVKLTWSRDEDLRHDFYRPFALHHLIAGLDAQGTIVAWKHRYATTSISQSMDPATKQPESDEVAGAEDLPYAIPNVRVEYHPAPSPVPRGWWRSVDASINTFAVESFLDECAAAARRDPLRYRTDLLKEPRRRPYPGASYVLDTERLKGVLSLAAEKAAWGAPLPQGRGRGVAAQFSFETYCAQVAEVEAAPDGRPRVRRVVAAVDCGRVVHPGQVAAQIEGAVAFALSAALRSEITIDKGRVVQGNFNDFEVLRIDEAPIVETYIVPGDGPPTGVGEPGVPPAAPAVMNALFAATGRRIRRLPLGDQPAKTG